VLGKLWGADAVWKNAFTDSFGTGTAIAESPVKEGLLFVGTDDGLLQISENGGETWRKVDQFPGVPEMTYVTDVFPSPHDVNTLFVTLNDFHRGNFKPYLMKSGDLGRTWASISGDLPLRDPAWTIVQDPVNANLLFAGTEFGLSFTVDGGRHWVKIKSGMPVTPIRDLEIQARESDLVAASFGRGFFVFDDYSALRTLTPQLLSEEGVLFAPGRKARAYDEIGYYRAQGDNLASANPPMGALLTYYLRDETPAGGKTVLTITDAAGKQVRQLDASSKAGVHRTPWDLREQAPVGAAAPRPTPTTEGGEETPPTPPAGGRGGRGGGGGGGVRGFARSGPLVKAGSYKVTLGRLVSGTVTPIGQAQTVEVVAVER
jgi:hypothetical protein